MRKIVLAVFLLCAFAGKSTAQAPAFFTPAYEHPANAAPRAIVSADFNRDGFPDAALGGTGRDSIAILLHHGLEDGDEGQKFGPMREIIVGGGPFELAAADLNHDGWIDIAVANADLNTVTILLNGKHGNFNIPKIDVAVTQNPRGLAVADINRDGKLDIVVTKYLGTTVEVLLGAGNGTFPSRRTYTAPANSQGVAAGDFNNDGWIDFVVVAVSGRIAQYFTGPRVDVVRKDIAASMAFHVVTAGDFDRDGKLDFAAASTSQSVARVFYGSGTQSGAERSSALIPTAASPRGIEAADLNRNGTLELVLAGRASSTVSVLTRQADGTWQNSEFPAGAGARDVAIADHHRSGKPSILTANEFGNSLSLLSNVTELRRPAFAFDPVAIPEHYSASTLGIADFNHNGKPDAARVSGVLLDSTTDVRVSPDLGEIGAVGDFNGDGHADFVYGVARALKVFFGTGDGQFVAGPSTATEWFIRVVRTADLNFDGRLDVAIAVDALDNVNAAMEVWLGNGDGRFTRHYHADTYVPNDLALGDMDMNGTTDVLVTSRNGLVTFFTDRSGAAIDAKWFQEGTPRYGLAVGNLNYDDTPDVVMTDARVESFGVTWGSTITIALGNGDGTLREQARYDVNRTDEPWGSFRIVTLGDLDHDSYADIITGNGAMLFSNTDGTFSDPQFFGVHAWYETVITDMNGDGLNDIMGYTQERGWLSQQVIMRNTLRQPSENRAPVGVNLPASAERNYAAFFDSDDQYDLCAGEEVFDPDLHLVRFRWTRNGEQFATLFCSYPKADTGVYEISVTADDQRGKSVSDTMTYTITPHKETVIWTAFPEQMHGAWRQVGDETAANEIRLQHPNANAPKLNAPLANPVNYIEFSFVADKTQVYKLWMRLKAENNYWGNDSVWVQFTGAKDTAGNPLYAIGSSSGLAVNLEECSGCGISGWGWEDDGWGAVNVNGTLLHFPDGGLQRIRIQTREDGVSIDQIVLSAEQFKTVRPGKAKNDTTILQARGIF